MANYFDFILTKFSLSYKENSEYKINLWSAILANISIVFVFILFFEVLSSLISNILNWTRYDFILYSILILTGSKIYFIICIRKFNRFLLNGDLNTILTKPINPLFHQFFNNLRGPILIIFPILILIILILIFLGNYSNFLLAFLSFFLGFILLSLILSIAESLAFFMKNNFFIINLVQNINQSSRSFTPKLFENFSILFYFLPYSLIGFFTIEILNGKVIFFLNYLIIFLELILIFFILLLIIWKIGLKKYEAFG